MAWEEGKEGAREWEQRRGEKERERDQDRQENGENEKEE